MSDVLIIIGTAFVANIIWGCFIDPWLDARPRKAVFIEPKLNSTSDSKDKNKN